MGETTTDNAAEKSRTIHCTIYERFHVLRAFEQHVGATAKAAEIRRREKLFRRISRGINWLQLSAHGVPLADADLPSDFSVALKQAEELQAVLEKALEGKPHSFARNLIWPLEQLEAFVADRPAPSREDEAVSS